MVEEMRLVPPDLERAIVSVLSEDKPFTDGGPWVATRYPRDAASEVNGVIRVSLTGGPRPVDYVVVAPTVLIECWHDDEDVAWAIASKAWSDLNACRGVVNGVVFNHVKSTSPNNNPDVNRLGMIRYQFVSQVWSRLTPFKEVYEDGDGSTVPPDPAEELEDGGKE